MAISGQDLHQWHLTRYLPKEYEEKINDLLRLYATVTEIDGKQVYLWRIGTESLRSQLQIGDRDLESVLIRFRERGWRISLLRGQCLQYEFIYPFPSSKK